MKTKRSYIWYPEWYTAMLIPGGVISCSSQGECYLASYHPWREYKGRSSINMKTKRSFHFAPRVVYGSAHPRGCGILLIPGGWYLASYHSWQEYKKSLSITMKTKRSLHLYPECYTAVLMPGGVVFCSSQGAVIERVTTLGGNMRNV